MIKRVLSVLMIVIMSLGVFSSCGKDYEKSFDYNSGEEYEELLYEDGKFEVYFIKCSKLTLNNFFNRSSSITLKIKNKTDKEIRTEMDGFLFNDTGADIKYYSPDDFLNTRIIEQKNEKIIRFSFKHAPDDVKGNNIINFYLSFYDGDKLIKQTNKIILNITSIRTPDNFSNIFSNSTNKS